MQHDNASQPDQYADQPARNQPLVADGAEHQHAEQRSGGV